MAECDIEVTTADGRRWVVDKALLSLPDDLSPEEAMRAAVELLADRTDEVRVPADLLGSWLDWAAKREGDCCGGYSSPCNEHEKALAVARRLLGREPSDG